MAKSQMTLQKQKKWIVTIEVDGPEFSTEETHEGPGDINENTTENINGTKENYDDDISEKEIVIEGEALSNSGKAEIVIKASSQDTEENDGDPTKYSAAIKTSESNSEEIITNDKNKNVEIAESKYDPKPLDETREKGDKIDNKNVVKETEPVVTEANGKESETTEEDKV